MRFRKKRYLSRRVKLITTIGYDGKIRILMDAGRRVENTTIGDTTYYWGDHELMFQGKEFRTNWQARRLLKELARQSGHLLICRIESVYITNP